MGGLNNYLYYFWGILIIGIVYKTPENPILIIKAPILLSL